MSKSWILVICSTIDFLFFSFLIWALRIFIFLPIVIEGEFGGNNEGAEGVPPVAMEAQKRQWRPPCSSPLFSDLIATSSLNSLVPNSQICPPLYPFHLISIALSTYWSCFSSFIYRRRIVAFLIWCCDFAQTSFIPFFTILFYNSDSYSIGGATDWK